MNIIFLGFGQLHQRGQTALLNLRIASVGETIKAAARELSDPKNIKQKNLFRTWFGTKENEDYSPVINNIQKLSHGFHNATVRVHDHYWGVLPPGFCTNTLAAARRSAPRESSGGYAYQEAKVSYRDIEVADHRLIICPDFWNARIMGRQYNPGDTQLGSIMHEMTHMFGGTVDRGSSGSDADAYGEANCILNAQNTPDIARINADNYCYYLTQLYFSSAVRH